MTLVDSGSTVLATLSGSRHAGAPLRGLARRVPPTLISTLAAGTDPATGAQRTRQLATLLAALDVDLALDPRVGPGPARLGIEGVGHLPEAELRPVKGLPGLLRGRVPDLDLLLGRALDDDAGRLAEHLAATGRPAPRIVDVEDFDALGAIVDRCVSDGARPCTIVVSGDRADGLLDALEAMFLALTGSRSIGVRARSTNGRLDVTPAGDAADPGALVRSLALVLDGLGLGASATRLRDAWRLALEDGLHTVRLAALHPYGRCVDDDDFVAEVALRVGRRPRRDAGAPDGAWATPARRSPSLRVVSPTPGT